MGIDPHQVHVSPTAQGGLITSFNIYISHVKGIKKEERGTSSNFFFGIFCSEVFAIQKNHQRSLVTTSWSEKTRQGCGSSQDY